MSRFYTAVFKGVAVTAQQDFFEITAPSTQIVKIHEWTLSQETETGDAQEEMLRVTCNRGTSGTTSGSGGTTVTSQPIEDTDSTFGGTVEANNTTKMSAGTIEELEVYAWNERIPFSRLYTPETRPILQPSARWTLELETTPADSVTISGTVTFEAIG